MLQVLIEAETNNKGFIAVDDITVTLGICPGVAVIFTFCLQNRVLRSALFLPLL